MPTHGRGKPVHWYIGSDLNIHIEDLHLDGEEDADDLLDDATITGTMADTSGAAVSGVGTITFTSDGDGTGAYTGRIPSTASLTFGSEYRLTVVVTSATNEALTLMLQGRAIYAGG